MAKQEKVTPKEQNRLQLTQLLQNKAALKQDIAEDAESVFLNLKETIKSELVALRAIVADERVRLHYK